MIKWDRLTLTGRLTNIYSKNVSKRTLVKAVALMAIDISFYFFATISFYYIISWHMMTPTRRGFSCDDDSIRQPHNKNTVPTLALLGITLGVPFGVIIVGNFLAKVKKNVEDMADVIRSSTPIYLDYILGFWLLTLVLDIIKCSVGRLRPNFVAMCQPDESAISACAADSAAFVSKFTCTNPKWRDGRNSMMSFPSGHAAASVFALLFLHYFLNQIIARRVTDYWHFTSDVIGGIVVAGLVFHVFLQEYRVSKPVGN
ncbi:Protein F13E6.5 [Aphelenchoides avenae]|nr:Protein F13E6.5 [Aphelenchus avenae]